LCAKIRLLIADFAVATLSEKVIHDGSSTAPRCR